jgi:oxidase EvaA
MNNNIEKHLKFLKSALCSEGFHVENTEVINWIKKRNQNVDVKIKKVKFKDLHKWSFTKNYNSLVHESGKFFSIEGIKVETNYGLLSSWEQPIINQPEIGFLGFITKEFNGILHFLVQAKIEPGNINKIQLSPTLQATKSNYSQVHKGKKPLYLEFFQQRDRCKILLDQLQSEQGARFLQKRNRNIIIQTDEDIELHEDFNWLTLGQIKDLIQYDNLVNMDTRTVISAISYGNLQSGSLNFVESFKEIKISKIGNELLFSAFNNKDYHMSNDDIIAWLTELKCKFDLSVSKTSLSKINDWKINDYEIFNNHNKFFKVIAADIKISNREVSNWMQPLVQPAQDGLIAFVIKKINNVYHFLVQAKLESGNFDILELAPTVQCLTGNYRKTKEGSLPFLNTVLEADKNDIIFDTYQSEEGGRFFHEQNRHIILKVDENFDINIPENYCWITLNQLYSFLKYNNYVNIQARSLISAINFK